MFQPMSSNAQRLLAQRYLQPGETGWHDVVNRIIRNVAVQASYDYQEFIASDLLQRVWMPNSPCIWGAGSKIGGLFACFVVGPTLDELEDHAETLKDIAVVTRFGGGCGFTGTMIRQKDAPVSGSAHGKAYGPNWWAVNTAAYAEMISQGGKRNAALMYTLRSDHPDLEQFIELKQTKDEKFAHNFNQSVMATDEFMRTAIDEPDSNEARILARIAFNSWRNGEPGLLFYDTINQRSPYYATGQRIEATNPCGEEPLPPYGACNLGSVNLNHSVFYDNNDRFNYDRLEPVVRRMTRFLDDVGTVNRFPNEKFETWYNDNRPVGIGIMGFADALLRQEVPYGHPSSIAFISNVCRAIMEISYDESTIMGRQFGIPKHCEQYGRRNITTGSIAPTGSIALMADCSHSLEPIYSPKYIRYDQHGNAYEVEHELAHMPYFRSTVNDDISKVPNFADHVRLQAAAQAYIDAGVSKTINFMYSATPDDVLEAMKLAWVLGCKGITGYRDGSRETQVLNVVSNPSTQALAVEVKGDEEFQFDPSCPTGVCTI